MIEAAVPTAAVPLQLVPPAVVTGAASIAGQAAMAGGVGALMAASYRWYARETVSGGLAVLVGLAAVAVYLNTTAALGQVIGGEGTTLLDPDDAMVNTITFMLAGGSALVGRGFGDRFASALGAVTGAREVEADISTLVRSVGRVIAVELPESAEEIDDIVGYDPESAETKAAIAGKTLLFPRGLTVAELRERLAERLRDDYGVGHVDADIAQDGTVEYLAIGSRASGIGPTLPPGTAATAVTADPAYAASAGDVVQVWSTDGESPTRVTTADLRGAAGDVATLALDEADAEALDPAATYRLVTLPSEPRADREFAALLRGAAETMGTVEVADDSDLVGAAVDDLSVSVVAIRSADGEVLAIPRRDRTLAAGDTVYAVARPEDIRRVERAGTPP